MSSHPQASTPSWSCQEFLDLDLGDTRLNDRLVHIADALTAQSMSPISTDLGDWSPVKAAYRFFDNDKVSAEKVLDPHFQQTVERMRVHERVFAIQDTTYSAIPNQRPPPALYRFTKCDCVATLLDDAPQPAPPRGRLHASGEGK